MLIPAQPGTTATFDCPTKGGEPGFRYLSPVVAWDDEGHAMVPSEEGFLVSVLDCDDNFDSLDWPDNPRSV